MGFDPENDPDLNEAGDIQTAYACQPTDCIESLGPPSNCGSPGGLAREALNVVAGCCGGDGGPPGGGGHPTSCVCCPVAVASGAEGSVSSPDGTGTVASCCGPDGACDDGDPCTDDDHCNGNPNYCPSEPAFTCCGRPKVCADDGDVCTLEQCVGGACVTTDRNCDDGLLCTIDGCDPVTGCYHTSKNCDDANVCSRDTCNPSTGRCDNAPNCSDRVCCAVGTDYFCCNTGQTVCCPRNPGYADHCCRSDQTCCPGGPECCAPEQTCCNGSCALKGACCKFDTGSCSEQTQSCCVQQGGTYQGDTTCSEDLCKPKCDNCQAFQRNFGECLHYVDDTNGTPCSTTACIEDVVDTAGCPSYPARRGPPKCNTLVVPHEVWLRQWVRAMPCPAQNVSWNVFFTPYEGCGTNCTTLTPLEDSCLVGACTGVLIRGPDERYGKPVCGCP